ncbi:ANTAR domain-containing protein [Nocardia terpenica]|uniref:ANTAR domain-containing protein n=2 Tax=Nocardia terpenica TaxID=455432 RepID=A0A6G9Z496_9NOCA|nr:ANTAR domain-containing protein [Nocardia terpenica]
MRSAHARSPDTNIRSHGGDSRMSDSDLLVSALGRLALLPLGSRDRSLVLLRLIETATETFDLTGAVVTLVEDGHCEVAGATADALLELEVTQQDCACGPAVEALRHGECVAVTDVREQSSRWPDYTRAAVARGVSAVAEIPMQLGPTRIGALGLYAPEPREWTATDLSVAGLLAGLAAGHLLNDDRLRRQQRLTHQLQHALDSRIVVEQAKGVLAGARSTTPDAAYQLIRAHARRRRIGVQEVARAIVQLGLRL